MKRYLSVLTALLLAIFIGLTGTSCNEDDEDENPKVESIEFATEGVTIVTVNFSEGAYSTMEAGEEDALSNASFTVSVSTGTILNTVVTHTAGDANAEIAIAVDGAEGEIVVTVTTIAGQIYTMDGTEFDAATLEATTNISFEATTYDEAAGVVTVKDYGLGTGTMTWTSDKIYLLDGFVFVNNGQTLTIEAGTIIKGKAGQEADASALIVARGAKIMAEGTAEAPIIFTAEGDDLAGSMPVKTRGEWGGLIILGNAGLNSIPNVTAIEGIPTTEPRGIYGGDNDADNSGVVTYVSIRHGGTDIGEGNEINGLTLGGVGSGTTFDYIEIIANKDDGVEFFGGTPNVKHLLAAYCADDSYDYDEGFRGKGQYWVAIQDVDAANRLGEHDGGTDPEDGTPYAIPFIANATYIGHNAELGEDDLIRFRDNAGGYYINSIFMAQAKGISIEILGADVQDSYKQFQDGNLKVENNIFWNVADGTQAKTLLAKTDKDKASDEEIAAANAEIATYWETADNTTDVDPGVTADNLIPTGDVSNVQTLSDAWFDAVTYQGAFDPAGTNWAEGWTLYFQNK